MSIPPNTAAIRPRSTFHFRPADRSRHRRQAAIASGAIGRATLMNDGLDTVITLSDGSTITVKFVTQINGGFLA